MHQKGKRKILIYNDQGAGPRGVYNLFSNLQKMVDLESCQLLVVDADYLKTVSWEKNTALLIMPGGRARPYYQSLGTLWEREQVNPSELRRIKLIGEGNQRIIQYVEQGGAYFGICAGAYYGAKITEFELGGRYEVLDEGLNLVSVIAKGPAYGLNKFNYASESGTEIAKVEGKIASGEQKIYFNGGPYFELFGDASKVEILLRYSNIPGKPIAAVEAHYGQGKVILLGVHSEFIPVDSVLHDSFAPTDLIKELSEVEESRQKMFALTIHRLGIPLNQKLKKEIVMREPQSAFKRTHFDVIGSTQDYLIENASTLLKDYEYVVITANEQTKGRGTQNRMWVSPPDVNIYATFGIKIPNELAAYFDLVKSPAVMEIMALAVAKTLEEFGLKSVIKWRNDVLVNGKKISGILCEPKMTVEGGVGLVGIGLNVNMGQEICTSLDQPVTSMAVEAGHSFDKEEVFNCLANNVNHYIKLYLSKNFSDCMTEINLRLAFVGKLIRVENQLSKQVITGVCLGIDETGQLKLKTADGSTEYVRWGRIIKNELTYPVNSSEKSETNENILQVLYGMSALALGLGGVWVYSKLKKPSHVSAKTSVPQETQPNPFKSGQKRYYSTSIHAVLFSKPKAFVYPVMMKKLLFTSRLFNTAPSNLMASGLRKMLRR